MTYGRFKDVGTFTPLYDVINNQSRGSVKNSHIICNEFIKSNQVRHQIIPHQFLLSYLKLHSCLCLTSLQPTYAELYAVKNF